MFQASEQWEIKGQALIYLQGQGSLLFISLFLFSSALATMTATLCYDIMALRSVIYIPVMAARGPFVVLVGPLPAGGERCWRALPASTQPQPRILLQRR